MHGVFNLADQNIDNLSTHEVPPQLKIPSSTRMISVVEVFEILSQIDQIESIAVDSKIRDIERLGVVAGEN